MEAGSAAQAQGAGEDGAHHCIGPEDCEVLMPLQADSPVGAVRGRLLVLGTVYEQAEPFDVDAYSRLLDCAAAVMRERQSERCMAWNLGWPMERQHAALFDGRVLEYGSPQTMCNLQPLWQMVNIVHSVRSWLGQSPGHTAFIHCLHPERLIVFVRCLLARWRSDSGAVATAEAQSAVDELCNRIRPALPLPPSHTRYAEYYEALERRGCYPQGSSLKLLKLVVNGIPTRSCGSELRGVRIALYQGRSSRPVYYLTFPADDENDTVQLTPNVVIDGDAVLTLQMVGAEGSGTAACMLCRYAFHTALWTHECDGEHIQENDQAVLRVQWDDVDVDTSSAEGSPAARLIGELGRNSKNFFMEIVLAREQVAAPLESPRGDWARSWGIGHETEQQQQQTQLAVVWPSYYLTSALRVQQVLQAHRPAGRRGDEQWSEDATRFAAVRLNPHVWQELNRALQKRCTLAENLQRRVQERASAIKAGASAWDAGTGQTAATPGLVLPQQIALRLRELSPYELKQFKDMKPEDIEKDFQNYLARSRSAVYTPRSPAVSPRRKLGRPSGGDLTAVTPMHGLSNGSRVADPGLSTVGLSSDRWDGIVQTPTVVEGFTGGVGNAVARPLFATPVDNSLDTGGDGSTTSKAVGGGKPGAWAAGVQAETWAAGAQGGGFLAPFEVEEALGLPSPMKNGSSASYGIDGASAGDSVIAIGGARSGSSPASSAAAAWVRKSESSPGANGVRRGWLTDDAMADGDAESSIDNPGNAKFPKRRHADVNSNSSVSSPSSHRPDDIVDDIEPVTYTQDDISGQLGIVHEQSPVAAPHLHSRSFPADGWAADGTPIRPRRRTSPAQSPEGAQVGGRMLARPTSDVPSQDNDGLMTGKTPLQTAVKMDRLMEGGETDARATGEATRPPRRTCAELVPRSLEGAQVGGPMPGQMTPDKQAHSIQIGAGVGQPVSQSDSRRLSVSESTGVVGESSGTLLHLHAQIGQPEPASSLLSPSEQSGQDVRTGMSEQLLQAGLNHAAATVIQRATRAKLGRIQFAEAKQARLSHVAATSIQRVIRGRLGRVLFAKAKEQAEAEATKKEAAAVKKKIPPPPPPPPPLPAAGFGPHKSGPPPAPPLPPGSVLRGGAPPPPPPPLPGGRSGVPVPPPMPGRGPPPPGAPPLPAAAPAKKLRSIHWKVIPKSRLDNTIWAEQDSPTVRAKLEEEEQEELEGLFLEQQPKKTAGQGGKKKKPQVVTLIDKQKSQGIEIVLKGLKMSHQEVVAAIAGMDEDRVSADQLYSLLQLWPSHRDTEILLGYEGDKALLATADRLLLELLQLPSVEQTMQCFLFKCQLHGSMEDVDANVTLLQRACREVKESRELARVLTLALNMGNVLNQGKRTGAAGGIALSSLAKFKDTKSADNKTNLLRHLAAVLVRKHDEEWIGKFGGSMPSLSAAAYVSMTDIAADVREMSRGLKDCAILLKNNADVKLDANDSVSTSPAGFVEKLSSFHSSSSKSVEALQIKIAAASTQFEQLCTWLGEDAQNSSPGSIFETICSFSNMLIHAHEENEMAARQALLKQKMQAAKQAAMAVKAVKEAAATAALRWHVVLIPPEDKMDSAGSWKLQLRQPGSDRGADNGNDNRVSCNWSSAGSGGNHGHTGRGLPTRTYSVRSELLNEIRGKEVSHHNLRKVTTIERPKLAHQQLLMEEQHPEGNAVEPTERDLYHEGARISSESGGDTPRRMVNLRKTSSGSSPVLAVGTLPPASPEDNGGNCPSSSGDSARSAIAPEPLGSSPLPTSLSEVIAFPLNSTNGSPVPASIRGDTSPANAKGRAQDTRLGLLKSPSRSLQPLKDRMAAAAAAVTEGKVEAVGGALVAERTSLKERMAATMLGGAPQAGLNQRQHQQYGDQLGACMAALEAEMKASSATPVAAPCADDARLGLLKKRGPGSPPTLKQRMAELACATPSPPVDASDMEDAVYDEEVYE